MRSHQHYRFLIGPATGLVLISLFADPSRIMAKQELAEPLFSSSSLLYSTFFGGSAGEGTDDDAIASFGNDIVYIAGGTNSPDFPTTPGAFDTTYNNVPTIFVAKLNIKTNQLIYSTFLGGQTFRYNAPSAVNLAVDSSGNAYVVFATTEINFPTTPGAYDTVHGGGMFDVVVVKINPSGTDLVYSTFLGGMGEEKAYGIDIDSYGSAYISGMTDSPDFPTTPDAYQTTITGTSLFVTKLNSDGSNIEYSTFLHGSTSEYIGFRTDIDVDNNGMAYVTGQTESADFPTTIHAFDTTFNGGWTDIFVVKLNSDGSNLIYSTFLGGNDSDWAMAIDVDESGYAFITGSTPSVDFPTTAMAVQKVIGGGNGDAFIAKINPEGNSLIYSSYIGGGAGDGSLDMVVDSDGAAYIIGETLSYDFPVTPNAYQPARHGDCDDFIVKITPNGSAFEYSSYLGGNNNEQSGRVDLSKDKGNVILMIGSTRSTDFPTTPSAYDTSFEGDSDNFIVEMAMGEPTVLPFLDLPIEYTVFSTAANGNYGGNNSGYVNSWFDHNPGGQIVTTWTGSTYSGANATSPYACIRESCYDGHNGIDFRSTQSKLVYAAANGSVFGVVDNCSGCTTGYGNRVWINHGNGYATLYAHLQEVYVSNGTFISDRNAQSLGIMGSTGRATGIHLHFGLYYDQNKDAQWSESEAVDPYGSQGSNYLWIHPLSGRQLVDSAGGMASTPSGNSTITIPAGAVSSSVTLKMWDTPPISNALTGLRSIGNSFLMSILEWLTGEVGPSSAEDAFPNTFDLPVTVSAHYDPSALIHLDINQLAIYQWDDISQGWVPLSTALDLEDQQATAQTTQPGNFDVQAPLICPADILEANDDYDNASLVYADGTITNSLFDIAQDDDWFKFEAAEGNEYILQTTNLAADVDTAIEIYDMDGMTLLASDDNGGGGKASSLTWQAPSAGVYFVRAVQSTDNSFGCGSFYDLSVVDVTPPAIASITRADPNPTSAASVDFTVTVSEFVTGLDVTDFTLTTTGGVAGTSMSAVSGEGTVYTVSVNTGSGEGTLRLDVVDDDTIVDIAGNPLGGVDAGNGNYIDGEYYTIEKPPPGAFDKLTPSNTSITFISTSLTWNTSDGGEEYEYCYDESNNDVCDSSWISTSTSTSAAVSGLTANTAYYWQVRAINGGGTTYADGGSWWSFTAKTQTFSDVPVTYWAWAYIERLFAAGITGGCASSPLRYCPANSITRAEMAIFLERGMNGSSYTPPAATGTVFADVPIAHWAAAWIEKLYADGITGGCGGGNYCPAQAVTRAQMAIFLLRAKHGSSYTPPAPIGVFGDVPVSYWAAAWIEQLYAEGITGGCGDGNYCPNQSMNRAEMAVFLVRTFSLP